MGNKYLVECTVIYNGSVVVEAEDEWDAIGKAGDMLDGENLDGFPNEVVVGDATFRFGEATADNAEEL